MKPHPVKLKFKVCKGAVKLLFFLHISERMELRTWVKTFSSGSGNIQGSFLPGIRSVMHGNWKFIKSTHTSFEERTFDLDNVNLQRLNFISRWKLLVKSNKAFFTVAFTKIVFFVAFHWFI